MAVPVGAFRGGDGPLLPGAAFVDSGVIAGPQRYSQGVTCAGSSHPDHSVFCEAL